MQTTSSLYKTILADPSHVKIWKAVIENTEYLEDQIVSISISRSLYGNNIIGGTYSAGMTITLKDVPSEDIPKMARVQIYYCLAHAVNHVEESSEWLSKGVFWVNQRRENKIDETIELTCVDGMMFGEQMFYPEEVEITDWNNKTMREVARMCAQKMSYSTTSMTLEHETDFQNAAPYVITAPPIGYTVRQVLSAIAISHCGNIIVTENNQLRLVPFYSAPAESNILTTELGSGISFGGVRIVV